LTLRQHTTPLAWSVGAATVLLVGTTLALGAVTPQERLPEDLRLGPLWFVIPVYPLVVAAVGTLIASRRPGNSIGWLMCATAVIGALVELGPFYSNYNLAGGRPGLVAVQWIAWVAKWIWLPWLMLQLIFVPVLFPDGRLPSKRWAWLLWTAALTTLIGIIARALSPGLLADSRLHNPVAVHAPYADFPRLAGIASVVLILMAMASLASVFFRLRSASGDRRQQLKWFGSAIAVLVMVVTAARIADEVIDANSPLLEVVFPSIYVTIPIAIGFAVLRYRLYDIDLVINRTLVYATSAAFISAVYLIVVLGVGALVGSRDHVSLLPWLAAGMVALAFQPARARLQRLADRVVYGRRATPYDALAALSRRMSETEPSEQVLTDTARALCDAIGVRAAFIWLRGGAEWRVVAQWPADAKPEDRPLGHAGPPGVRTFPIHNQGTVLGAIAVTVPAGRALSPADKRLVADVASQAGLLFRNLGLTADLVSRVGQLRESRRRLVTAQEEERRRIERNLHDGAQQDLFSLKVSIRHIRTLLQRNPDEVQARLEQLEEEAEKALLTVKELARGVYPPLLTVQGIAGALGARARTAPVGVHISNSGVGRYPADVEEAVYFACAEALQNAVKHAQPTMVKISLTQQNGELTFEVQDDGRGFDVRTTTGGAGLQSMRDRLDVVGGTMEIVSTPDLGTAVKGRVHISPIEQPVLDDGAPQIAGAPAPLLPSK
jgi:signal transduction histidine kinase